MNSDNMLHAPNAHLLIVIHDYVTDEHSRNGQCRKDFRFCPDTGLVFHIGAPANTKAYDDNMHFFLDPIDTAARTLPETAWQLYIANDTEKNEAGFHSAARQTVQRILQALLEQGIRGFDLADLLNFIGKTNPTDERIIVMLNSWENRTQLAGKLANTSIKGTWLALYVEEKDAVINISTPVDELLNSFAKDRELDLFTCNPQKTLGAYMMLLAIIKI